MAEINGALKRCFDFAFRISLTLYFNEFIYPFLFLEM